MKAIHKIVDIAAELSDSDMSVGVTFFNHDSRQPPDISFSIWSEYRRVISQHHTLSGCHYTADELLAYLKMIRDHGYRKAKEQAA